MLRAVIFDLDDTLVATYDDLIVPLEKEAARLMAEAAGGLSADALAGWLLRARRKRPGTLEEDLRASFPELGPEALEAREEVFRSPSAAPLKRLPSARKLLEELRPGYRLCLLTHGDPDFQRRKLDRSALAPFFDDIVVLEGSGRSKGRAIRELGRRHGLGPGRAAVVGNRLDLEIRFAVEQNQRAVWFRCGEGSEMTPREAGVLPDATIESLRELRPALRRLDHPRGAGD